MVLEVNVEEICNNFQQTNLNSKHKRRKETSYHGKMNLYMNTEYDFISQLLNKLI